jgi:hypothetical protein
MWHRYSSLPVSLLLSLAAVPAAAQVEFTIHGGLHMGEAGGVRHAIAQQTSAAGSSRLLGEATTAGARLGINLSEGWQLDGGVAWSRNSNWEGAVSRTLPSFEAQTLFLSSTVQGWHIFSSYELLALMGKLLENLDVNAPDLPELENAPLPGIFSSSTTTGYSIPSLSQR